MMHTAHSAQCGDKICNWSSGGITVTNGSKEKRLGNGSICLQSPWQQPTRQLPLLIVPMCLPNQSWTKIPHLLLTVAATRPVGRSAQNCSKLSLKKNCARLYVGVKGSQVGLCGRDLTLSLSLTTIPGTSAQMRGFFWNNAYWISRLTRR